jgi:hypothetical protein
MPNMNNQFEKLNNSMAESVTREATAKKFRVVVKLAGAVLGVLLTLASSAANQTPGTSTIFDAAGDAMFPFDLYNAPVPTYLDIVRVSVSSRHGVFHFEIQMNTEIPADPSPGFTPNVNHLGVTMGIVTDRRTAGEPFKFFGQTDTYRFNFLIGALYSFADSGIGLNLGWSGFLIDASTFTAVKIPLEIRGDTLVFETSALSLGNPSFFDWAAGSECDPVPISDEKTKSTLLVDFAPDHGVVTWFAE